MIILSVLALLAADPTAVPAAAEPAAPQQTLDKVAYQRRVCIVAPITGSRVDRRECHSRADWAAMGVDPFKR